MCRRKGTLSIILILLFSALLSASTALVLFLTRGSAAAVSHEEGLRSVYAAESGANWALSRLSSGAGGSTALTLEEGDRTILPVSLNIHHAVADGFHLSRFFLELQELLDAPEIS